MAYNLRTLLLLGVGLAPAMASARPAVVAPGALLARHRLPTAEAAATGRALLLIGDTMAAMAAFRQALAENATDGANATLARNGLAACYERLGRDDLARESYEQALLAAPDSALVMVNLGGLLVRTGRAADAIALLQRAATLGDAEIAAAARRLLTRAGYAVREHAIAAQHAALIGPRPLAPAASMLATAAPVATVATAATAAPAAEATIVAPAPAPATEAPAIAAAAPARMAYPPAPAVAHSFEAPAASANAVVAAPQGMISVRIAEGVSVVTTASAQLVTAAAGEMRLVASAPAAELVARLGADAALTEPARPWTAADEARVEAAAALVPAHPALALPHAPNLPGAVRVADHHHKPATGAVHASEIAAPAITAMTVTTASYRALPATAPQISTARATNPAAGESAISQSSARRHPMAGVLAMRRSPAVAETSGSGQQAGLPKRRAADRTAARAFASTTLPTPTWTASITARPVRQAAQTVSKPRQRVDLSTLFGAFQRFRPGGDRLRSVVGLESLERLFRRALA